MNLAPNQQQYIREHYIKHALTLLGLTEPFTPEDLKTAYREKSKIYHPDKGGDQETMARLVNAYEMLSGKPQRNLKLPKPEWPRLQHTYVMMIMSGTSSYSNTTANTIGGWWQ